VILNENSTYLQMQMIVVSGFVLGAAAGLMFATGGGIAVVGLGAKVFVVVSLATAGAIATAMTG
jgi:hypothetical protein